VQYEYSIPLDDPKTLQMRDDRRKKTDHPPSAVTHQQKQQQQQHDTSLLPTRHRQSKRSTFARRKPAVNAI